MAAASGAMLAYAGSDAAGAAWYRPRPFAEMHVRPLYPHSANSSFPSGTVAVVAAVATVAFFAWPALGRVLVAATAMVAFGCVYVGVHYASDVTAGALAGAASDLAQPVVTYLRRSATTKIVVPRAQARLASDIGDGSKPGQASGCG